MEKESSFLEKLKKGMGVDIPEEELKEKEEVIEKKEEVVKKIEKEKKPKTKKKTKVKTLEMKTSPIEKEKVETKKAPIQEVKESKKEWFEPVGKLAVDVYQTETELVIQSAVAGVKVEDLEVSIEGDLITIRGLREKPFSEKADYFTQECYWGPFAREIILPVEIDPGRVAASIKEGVLTIRIPKILRDRKKKIQVKKLA